MSDVIISVEGLGKKYAIRHQGPRSRSNYKTVREALSQGALSLATRWSRRHREAAKAAQREDFWALRDVSFDLRRGQVLGIIGRNGAGKSTLLKILSRITEPSEGRVTLRGRVASLLEVGTGFHPELTGRENIFLNGSVLGMARAEIRRKFDEIVAFAGVEKFLDTPVKRYSSGMYVRLAFAVAAHLEPEILVVDEVLAVGDTEFQKKCLGKMQDVAASEGRTVLFVSHNMAAISAMTHRVIMIEQGRLALDDRTEVAIARYLESASSYAGFYEAPDRHPDPPYISRIYIDSGEPVHASGQDMTLCFEIRHPGPVTQVCFSFQILNQLQQPVVHCWIFDSDAPICRSGTVTELKCRIPRLALNIGSYSLKTFLSEPPGGRLFERLENVCSFTVEILGKQRLFPWRPEETTWLGDFEWSVGNDQSHSPVYEWSIT
ncbi:MAG TPA: ABC transporter ATP-binding protein [Acidobacteriaceae bacterium]|jgi:ABC-type polysaccharide/polyol phosphate transport system ATPase subunit|nr:ABC transporter ATP-binding protein [Acidobacteriaceae bacterium]